MNSTTLKGLFYSYVENRDTQNLSLSETLSLIKYNAVQADHVISVQIKKIYNENKSSLMREFPQKPKL